MAVTKSISISPQANALWKLLAKAAGVDHRVVRSIECSVKPHELLLFKVETFGCEENIGAALAEHGGVPERLPPSPGSNQEVL
jgi:hypothetical protein